MLVRMGKQAWEFSERMQVQELLRRLNVLPNMVVVVRNGEAVTEDEWLEPSDEVEVIRVISGGGGDSDAEREGGLESPALPARAGSTRGRVRDAR
ncbi:MAG: MoaD/ThiS family protein [Acidobacteria bacterium]|nr:MoaD/ThiS family protein [Acidobacteriota bacterium]MDW7984755.1 MoaD/ThiS family protein [Acidobacteriota bacterium]